MTLAQFAIAVDANPKWVQNAARILGRSFDYTADEARRLALVKRLKDALGIPLGTAWKLAGRALAADGAAGAHQVDSRDEAVGLVIDLPHFLSDFTASLSRALAHYEPRRRGRRRERGSAVERARVYGIDLTLLHESLALTPAERLIRLEENQEFTRRVRDREAA